MTITETPRDEAVNSKTWNVNAEIRKWHDEADMHAGLDPDEIENHPDNLLLNAGINRLLDLLIGAGGTAYNAANSRIGVGDSSTAAAATDTALIAATNKFYKLVSSVSRTNQTVTWVATVASADGNFAWNEWVIDNGTADSTTNVTPTLNRKVASMGTKASGSAWQITVTITIS